MITTNSRFTLCVAFCARKTTFMGAALAAAVAIAAGVFAPSVARANIIPVISTPTGLNPGDEFRIMFVTDSTTTVNPSLTLAYYNNFVTTAADGATYNGVPVAWIAVASVTGTSAIQNIPGDTSAPIYLANGAEVAPNAVSE